MCLRVCVRLDASRGTLCVYLIDELVLVFYAPFGLMVALLTFHSRMTSMVLVPLEVGAILRNVPGG